jgi:hypothetical protein
MPAPATWIVCATPAEATCLAMFLGSEGHFASWMVHHRHGLAVLTTAPALTIQAGLAVVGRA